MHRFLIIALVALFTVACGEKAAAPAGDVATGSDGAMSAAGEGLAGTWTMVGKDGHYIFRADGTGELKLGTIEKAFTWTTEGDVVAMTVTGEEDASAREMHYALTEDGGLELWVEGQAERSRFERQ